MKTEKAKKINHILTITTILITIYLIVKKLLIGNYSEIISNILYLLLLLLPTILNKKTKIKLPETFILIYYIYIILTILIGVELKLIEKTLWYDKITHFYFGILAAATAILILKKQKKEAFKTNTINILFIIGFVLLLAVCWEFGEFFLDKLFHMNNQRWKQTGVDDTMIDLLVAFIGSIIMSTIYLITSKKKH